MRHSPAATAVLSSSVRQRLGFLASALYLRGTWTMPARPSPTTRSSSMRSDSSSTSVALHSGSPRSSASTVPAATSRGVTDAPVKLARMPLSTNTCSYATFKPMWAASPLLLAGHVSLAFSRHSTTPTTAI
jgi:hypothetical protein